MNKGPGGAPLGKASCPLCHSPMLVANNKHGYPAAYCRECETQFQPRGARGSLLLLGSVHEWTNDKAAEQMLAVEDVVAMKPATAAIAPQLPKHLMAAIRKESGPRPPEIEAARPKPKRRSFLDTPL